MSFDKIWSNYVLNTLDTQKLDQMILNLNCQIPGCRTGNKKSLKRIHQSLKIATLSKRNFIEQEIMEEVGKLYKPLIEKEELQKYYKMTPSEFIAQIDVFKQDENQDTRLVVANYFLQSSTTLNVEKDEIVKHFTIDKKESNVIQISKKVIKAPILESVSHHIVEEKEQMTRKEAKDLKILKHLYDEAKEREKEQKQKIKELSQEIEYVSRVYDKQEKAYKKELKDLKYAFEKLDQDYKTLKGENEELAYKIKKTELGLPYIFLGSQFVKNKLDDLKHQSYPEAHAIYVSTKQWENKLGKEKHEVAEVYAFFYDIEWFLRDKLYEQYQEKLKVFPSDEHFNDYIKQNWEA